MRDGSLPGRPRYLAFLPDFLFRAEGSKAAYIGKAWLLALLPSMALSVVVNVLGPNAESPNVSAETPLLVLLVVVVAPLLETLIMILPLLAFNRLFGPGPAAILSAVGWGVAHSLAAPTWGLIVWWPFLILSIAYLTWRKEGAGTAILIVATIHSLQNSVVAFGLLLMTALDRMPPH